MTLCWNERLYRWVLTGIGLLAVTALYLLLFPGLRSPYLFVVLLHVGIGLLFIPVVVAYLWDHLRRLLPHRDGTRSIGTGALAAVCLFACLIFGLSLAITGATRPHQLELWLHQAGGWGLLIVLAGHLAVLGPERQRAALRSGSLQWAVISSFSVFIVIGVIDFAAGRVGDAGLAHADLPPADFSPSLAATASGGLIPAGELMDPSFCGGCHADAYRQWEASAHHFASFNNPFYRRSVEYAAERVGAPPTKFCGACHDPLLLFSGRMDHPVDASLPEAQAGITCQVCHGITEIRDLRGDGSYTIAPPGQYPFAGNRSALLRGMHDLLVRWKPGPHREAMLKPLHTTPEFCSVCHKVHIPEAVNHFKWLRGQDEYDNWHHSGVSGNAVMSWGAPNPSPKICRDCHMPAEASGDFGAKRRSTEGQGSGGTGQGEKPYTVRSHRFLAANTALPTINNQPEQLKATEQFLQDKKVSVEVVALHPSPMTHDPALCLLPLASCLVSPGQTVDLHVLIRNLGVGHTFPGGTLDSNEVWLEVTARDARGREFYHHGAVRGNGEVDPAAHFYKAVLLDRSARPIDKRNVHDWVSTYYARTIPPGAADVARYRVTVPNDAGDHIAVEAVLHYRKFSDGFSKFVFAGRREPDPSARVDQYVDESRWTVTDAPVPTLPVVDMAETRRTIPVVGPASLPPRALPSASLSDDAVKLLNSYGIGLLLQQDLNSAWTVLEGLTQQAPQFIEGRINLARVQLAEGALDDAEASLQRVLALSSDYPKALYLLGAINRQRGDYDRALVLFKRVADRYPNDRLVCNELAQLYYLQGRYQEARNEITRALAIDPENLSAHYYLMLIYEATGEKEKAQEARARYLRYKPDESVIALTGRYRLEHPETDLESQPAHVHE